MAFMGIINFLWIILKTAAVILVILSCIKYLRS